MRSWCISCNQKCCSFFLSSPNSKLICFLVLIWSLSLFHHSCMLVQEWNIFFFTISINLTLIHSISVGSAESFSPQILISWTPCYFFQRSNHLRLAAKFWSPPIALFRDVAFSWSTGPLIGDPFSRIWVNSRIKHHPVYSFQSSS